NPASPKAPGNKATLAAERLLDGEAEALTRKAVEMASNSLQIEVVDQRRQAAGLDRDEQDEARPLGRSLPKRCIPLQCRIGCLQVGVRADAEHVVGGVVAADVRRVAERLKLARDPVRLFTVAAVADEDVGHARTSLSG